MELTKIEQRFNKIIPDWISQYKNKKMSYFYKKKLESYTCCLVGDVRDKLGLSRKYYNHWTLEKEDWVGDNRGDYNVDYCDDCHTIADKLFELEGDELKEEKFDETLVLFKEHLEKEHDKLLE